MKPNIILAAVLLCAWAAQSHAAPVSRAAVEQVKLVEERAAVSTKGKVQEYARELLESAKASIAAAHAAIANGNEKEAQQKTELATLQLNAADVKAAEKELLEQVAVRRAELKKLEAQLERYRQGEVN